MTDRKKELTLLFILFIFCLALRLAFLTQKNMWFDEVYSWHITQGSVKDIITDTSADIHPPLYYFILKIWELIFGESVYALRFLSVLIGSSAIFFIYALSRKVLDIEKSVLVILLYSVSPLNLFFSQEVRMSILNLLLNAGSVFFFIRVMELKPGIKIFFKNINTYAYIIFTLLALYTHYFSFLVLFAQIAFLIYSYKKQIKRIWEYVICYLIITICYYPWFPIMLRQAKGGQSWRYPQTVGGVIQEFYAFIKDLSMGFYYRYADQTITNILGFITLFIFCVLLIIVLKEIFTKNRSGSEIDINKKIRKLLIFLAIIPALLAILISFRQWIEYFRYLSIIIPFILIVFVFTIDRLNIRFQLGLLTVFFLINIYGDYLYYKYDFKNNDYRELISTLNSKDLGKEEIFVYPHYFGWIMNYYRIENHLNYPAPFNYGWEFGMMLDTVNVKKPKGLWLVMDYHSADQSTYPEKLNSLEKDYKISYEKKFKVEPDTIALYGMERISKISE